MIDDINVSNLKIYEIYYYSLKVFLKNIVLYLTIGLLVGVPASIPGLIFGITETGAINWADYLTSVANMALQCVHLLPIIMVILSTEWTIHDKPRLGFFNVFNVSFSKWARLILTFIISSLLIRIGLIFMVIPGIIAMVYFTLAYPITVLSGEYSFSAIMKSYQMIKGHWWRIFIIVGLFKVGITIAQSYLALLTPNYTFIQGIGYSLVLNLCNYLFYTIVTITFHHMDFQYKG